MPNVSKKKFIDNYIRNIPQILSHQIVADTETPVSTLLKISKNEKYSFLLESVEGELFGARGAPLNPRFQENVGIHYPGHDPLPG